MLAHILARRRRDRHLSIQKRCGGCMPVTAHTRQGRRRAMAWSDRLIADLGSPDTPMLAHILAWRRQDRLLSFQKRCGGCMPVAAHTRHGRWRALARSARLAADLGSPVKPMLAHILAWRRRDRTFVHSETVRRLHARGGAHSARASESTGAICKAGCQP